MSVRYSEIVNESAEEDKAQKLATVSIKWTTSQKKNAELAANALREVGINAMTEQPSGRKVDARFVAIGSPTNGILVNPRSTFWKDPVASAKQQFAIGHLSTDDPIGVLLHEISHTVFDPEGHWMAASQRDIAAQVSKYAQTNPKEFVSEVFAGLYTGKTYSEEVMNLYRIYTRKRH